VAAPVVLSVFGSAIAFILSGTGPGGASVGAGDVLVDWRSVDRPMAVDANGDGMVDIVGWLLRNEIAVDGTTDHLAAFDGRDGSRLWMSPSLGENASTTALAATAGDAILVLDKGMARGLSLSDGQPRWQTQLGEQAERVCAAPGQRNAVIVKLKDERRVRLSSDGASVRPAEAEPCTPVWSTRETPPDEAVVVPTDGPRSSDEADVDPPGMYVERPLHQPGSEHLVLLGTKQPGTRLPMAAAYACDDVTRGGGFGGRRVFGCTQPELLWKSVVPASKPMEASPGAPEVAALRNGVLYVGYEASAKDDRWRVTAFEVTTGRRLWDQPALVEPSTVEVSRDLSRLLPTSSGLFVDHGWSGAGMLDVATGEPKFAVAR
jgi:outer membrane protein assembly factor BamB